MTMRWRILVVGAVLLVAAQAAGWAAEAPVAVSPGAPSQVQEISTRCPTFSWATVDGARGYELAVGPARPAASTGKRARSRARGDFLQPALEVSIQGPASSWTPPTRQCLQEGSTYAWRVRETDGSGFAIGDWSEARYFRVAGGTPEPAGDPAPGQGAELEGTGKGNGTGGIPAVLNALDELRMDIQTNDDLLNQRLDALQARLDAVDMKVDAVSARVNDVDAHVNAVDARVGAVDMKVDTVGMTVDTVKMKVKDIEESQMPCTPKQWLLDRCAKQGHPLDMSATFCFDVGLGAELGAEFSVEPGVEVDAGAAWTNGPNGEAKMKIDLPGAIPLGPVPIFLPDLKVGAKAAGNASMQICFQGLTFAVSDLPNTIQDIEQFTQKFVDALSIRATDIYGASIGLVNDRGLDPAKLPDVFARLKDFHSPRSEGSDPLDAFKQGRMRDFLDTLPLDGEIKDLLNDPGQAIPSFDRSDPFALCDTLKAISIGGHSPGGAICDFSAEDMPDLAEVAENITEFPDAVIDKMCSSIPGLSCSSNTVDCRQQCRSQKRQCVRNCGVFGFACKRQCEAQRDSCVNGC